MCFFYKQTVATIADLSSLDVNCIEEDGSLVTVGSVRDVFELDKGSTLTADGITVAATNTGTGRWVRRLLPSAMWARRSTWYIDADNGDDENDGAAAGTALATWAELMRRIGDLETPQKVTVNLLSDLDEGNYVVRGRHVSGLWMVGQLTVLATGTVESCTTLDTTTTPVTRGVLKADSLDFTGLEGRQVRVTSGPSTGACAWILKVNPDGAGTSSVRVDEWYSSTTFVPVAGPSADDAIEVVSLTTVTGEIEVDCADRGSGTFFALKNVDLVGDAPLVQSRGWCALFQSRLRSVDDDHIAYVIGGSVELYGSLLDSYRLGLEAGASAILYSAALLDSDIVVADGYVECNFNNVAQFVSAGDSSDRASIALGRAGRAKTVSGTGKGCGFGAYDLAATGAALVSVEPGSLLNTGPGRWWTADQDAGTWGVEIGAGGTVVWPPGINAAEAFNLDPGGSGSEFNVGGTTTDAATLGATGTVNTANNAMAVPRAI